MRHNNQRRWLGLDIGEGFSDTKTRSQRRFVRIPRVRIAELMAVGAIAAFDFGAIRTLIHNISPGLADEVLVLGALPMANVLAFGLLIGLRRRSRGFLWGFETFGAVALVLFGLDYLCGFPMTTTYLNNFAPRFLYLPFVFWIIMPSIPQFVCALFGGFLFRRLEKEGGANLPR